MTTVTLLWAVQAALAGRALALAHLGRRAPGAPVFTALSALSLASLAVLLPLRGLVIALLVLAGLLYPLLVRALTPHNLRLRRLGRFTFVGALLLALIAWDRW
ncbi:hypothetical protein AB0K09_15190 [Streptomyces sp. NPDC049577]|uniref:hypothetical protein n=1 Tax=Streptomyces sp. NPDC049577 TaxID=3155153 RepID=UPI00342D5CBE